MNKYEYRFIFICMYYCKLWSRGHRSNSPNGHAMKASSDDDNVGKSVVSCVDRRSKAGLERDLASRLRVYSWVRG